MSWLAPNDGVLNIWIAPSADIAAARAITDDRKRGIRFHAWANSGTHVLYIQDEGGTEDWHVYAVPAEGGPARDLTPLPGVNARIQGLSLDEPNVMAVALNDRDKSWHDVYRIDIASGERELVYENRKELGQIVLDRQLCPQLAIKPRAKEGGYSVYRIAGTDLEPMMAVEHQDDLPRECAEVVEQGGDRRLPRVEEERQRAGAYPWRNTLQRRDHVRPE